jgi:hypothetical protein
LDRYRKAIPSVAENGENEAKKIVARYHAQNKGKESLDFELRRGFGWLKVGLIPSKSIQSIRQRTDVPRGSDQKRRSVTADRFHVHLTFL